MEFTGERVIPGEVDVDLWQEHQARYILARSWVAGARVLDAGCGAGYGSALLAEAAREVIGLDLAPEALDYARAHYHAPHLDFRQGNCSPLPFADAEFDWVVAFEVIEHLPDTEAFLREVRRVLRPKGRLVVSTPNRRFYSEERGYHNPFHVREFDTTEFEAALKEHFPHCQILAQNHVPAIVIERHGASAPLGVTRLPQGAASDVAAEPHFLLALCSAARLPDTEGLVLLAEGGNVLREREVHIHKLEADIKDLQERTNHELVQRLEWVERLKAELAQKQSDVVELIAAVKKMEAELNDRSRWALELKQQVEEKDARILERQRAVEIVEEELRKRSEWAMSLARDLESTQQKLRDTEALLQQRTEAALRLDVELAERTAWVQQLSLEANALRTDLEVLLDSFWHRTGRLLRLSPRPKLSPPALRPSPGRGGDA